MAIFRKKKIPCVKKNLINALKAMLRRGGDKLSKRYSDRLQKQKKEAT